MPSYSQYLQATQKLLRQSAARKRMYHTKICGKKFLASPGVFSPEYFKDTEIFASNLPIVQGGSLLEIGCGTGAVSIIALLAGYSTVTAVDINLKAVKITRRNASRHGLTDRFTIFQSDLFSEINPSKRFDLIFWNTPFGYKSQTPKTLLEQAVYDQKYRSIEEYIQDGHKFLAKHGRLLIGFSSTLGKLKKLEAICRNQHARLQLLYRERSSEVYPVYFEIFEVVY